MARNAYDRAMRDIYRKVERARKDPSYMDQLLRENAMQAKNINRRMERIEKAMGTTPGAVQRAREAAREIVGMTKFSRGFAVFRNDPDKLLEQLQAMARFDLSRSSTVKGVEEYRKESLKALEDKGLLTDSIRKSAEKQNQIFKILSSRSLSGIEDYMSSEEYVEMIVDAVDKGATAERFESALDDLMKRETEMDTDEIFEQALKDSYKPIEKPKRRRSRRKKK